MTVREIIKQYLDANGFDGLFDDDCACQKGDLCPCDSNCMDCQPGYKTSCPADCGEHDWHISASKEQGEGEGNGH